MEACCSVKGLVTLNLQGNSISEIAGLKSLVNLQWLSLAGNNIVVCKGVWLVGPSSLNYFIHFSSSLLSCFSLPSFSLLSFPSPTSLPSSPLSLEHGWHKFLHEVELFGPFRELVCCIQGATSYMLLFILLFQHYRDIRHFFTPVPKGEVCYSGVFVALHDLRMQFPLQTLLLHGNAIDSLQRYVC